ncbi:phosducin-like protein [Episyrphus balteatus]|uniref:phosducin-like protein n=1 Tax=Episyrphus balteatus TaxID=286459 RepID=UPI0024867C40|nr:phosducin-like protein [Episyrphus balteatus]
MATLEDKLMGEKLEYYCSSSEGEDNDDDCDDSGEKQSKSGGASLSQAPPAPPTLSQNMTHRAATNTGPKGVVQDWQIYKQLEAQKREENEKQRLELMKKLSMSAATSAEDEARKREEELEAEMAELMSEDFLQQFQKKRMAEMMQQCGHLQKFGKVFHLTSHEEFLNAVEKENKHITIIIHIYDRSLSACATLNKCLDTLAQDYQIIKFAKICSSVAGMSRDFRAKGLPALLVYKANNLIGNFVRITDDLSDDFFPSDLESFLVENGMIVDKNLYN